MKLWSKEYKHCVECGTRQRAHHAQGLCKTCYARMYNRLPAVRAQKHEYYRENAKARKRYSKQYYQAHQDERLAYAKNYREAHPDKIRAHEKKRVGTRLAYCHEWRRRNRDHVNAYNRRWKREHPQEVRDRVRLEAMRRRSAEGSFSEEQLNGRWQLFGGLCYICGVEATQTDHVIAVANGGSNWPSNLRPICAECNGRKGAEPWKGGIYQWATPMPTL